MQICPVAVKDQTPVPETICIPFTAAVWPSSAFVSSLLFASYRNIDGFPAAQTFPHTRSRYEISSLHLMVCLYLPF